MKELELRSHVTVDWQVGLCASVCSTLSCGVVVAALMVAVRSLTVHRTTTTTTTTSATTTRFMHSVRLVFSVFSLVSWCHSSLTQRSLSTLLSSVSFRRIIWIIVNLLPYSEIATSVVDVSFVNTGNYVTAGTQVLVPKLWCFGCRCR